MGKFGYITTSRNADKFVVRLPDGMRESISEKARQAKRSMNSEIVHRLALTLENEQAPSAVSTGETWTPVPGVPVQKKDDPTVRGIICTVDIANGQVVLTLLVGQDYVEVPALDYTPIRFSV